jgi:hypothetical protein
MMASFKVKHHPYCHLETRGELTLLRADKLAREKKQLEKQTCLENLEKTPSDHKKNYTKCK